MAKKNLFKKTLAIALAAALVLGAGPLAGLCGLEFPSISTSVSAAEEEPVWTVATEEMLEIVDGVINGAKEGVTLPANIRLPEKTEDGTAITKIKSSAFKGCNDIKAVMIPESIESIGDNAFYNCDELETVCFNSNVCTVDSFVTEKNSVLGNNAKFSTIVFGENVTSIPDYTCAYARNLKTVVFKGKVNTIGQSSFANCTSLADVYYAGTQDEWDAATIASNNEPLKNAVVHFTSAPEGGEEVDDTQKYEAFEDGFDVAVICGKDAFGGKNVKLSLKKTTGEREPGSINIVDNEAQAQVGYVNIKIVLSETGEIVQPEEPVEIRMVIPEKYIGYDEFTIVHRFDEGGRETLSTKDGAEKKITVSEDGRYLIFKVSKFSVFEVCAIKENAAEIVKISIKNNNGTKTINYGETLRLTANVENMPADAKVFWYVDGVKKGEGTTFEVSPESGSVEVTVKVVDANGNNYADTDISETETITVKSGFFQKLISFFKNLFGLSRIVIQNFVK